ncbi:pre-rRNA-processing protein pno1 [Gonapodya sp. JEL0774]|nr:pre-rRNA-processing protein pno1 [Gonapodya sp. JEL0774]
MDVDIPDLEPIPNAGFPSSTHVHSTQTTTDNQHDPTTSTPVPPTESDFKFPKRKPKPQDVQKPKPKRQRGGKGGRQGSQATKSADGQTEGDSEMAVDDDSGDSGSEIRGEELKKPQFERLKASEEHTSAEFRRIPIPPHRMSPLKQNWMKIYTPLVEHMKLQVRMNTRAKAVELKSSEVTDDAGSVQKGADFVKAFALGFEIEDALALLRLDDIYLDTFSLLDIRTLSGDNLSRAIGRVAGAHGRTRYAIENATRTRIVVADSRVSVLGSWANIKVARDAVCELVMGAAPGKVYR